MSIYNVIVFESLWVNGSGWSYEDICIDNYDYEKEEELNENDFDIMELYSEGVSENEDVLYTIKWWKDGDDICNKPVESFSIWNSQLA